MRYIDEKLTVGKNTKNTQKKKTKGFGYQVLGFGAGGGAPAFVEATGGTITESGNYKIHTFSSDGTFIVTNAGKPSGSTTVDYLVLAGGGGGGDGEEPRDFSGGSNDPCGFGNPKGDYYYDLVFNSFGPWIESNMFYGSDNAYDNYLDYIKTMDPSFTMDMLSDRYMEFFELLMTAIAEYACENNIRDVESIYLNPMPAILNF